ncbi:MAG: magnesium transporter [Bacteroidota bacterium]|nr:magnesium transporter [Bacteroidota bacterium]
MRSEIYETDISGWLERRDKEEIREALADVPVTDIAEILNDVKTNVDALFIFYALHRNQSVEVFDYLELGFQKYLLGVLPHPRIAELLNEMSADDRTSLLEELDALTLSLMVSLLSNNERAIALKLLGYPEDSIGRIMTPDFITIKPDWTVKDAQEYIRKYGKDSETLNIIYVVDEKGKLLDDIKIREFLLSSPNAYVQTLMNYQVSALLVNDDQETIVDKFKSTDRSALPVIDQDGILLGIVTIDDALDIAEEENTEDIQKLGAVEALDEPYLEIALHRMINKRAGWLIVLFFGEMLTATAMSYFEGQIEKAVVLSLFIPLIISSGGNTGSQAATLIIRAMALGEVTISDWIRVMKREILSGLALGGFLGVLGFIRIGIWGYFFGSYGEHWSLIGLTVGFSLLGVVLWGTISGSMLPIILKKLGLDPATSSAPFVATLVDVTGLVIYFTIAMSVLGGILL